MLPFWSLLLFQCPWFHNAKPLPSRFLPAPHTSSPGTLAIAVRVEITFLCPLSSYLMTLGQQPAVCSASVFLCSVQMHCPTTSRCYNARLTFWMENWNPLPPCTLSNFSSSFSLLLLHQAHWYHVAQAMSLCSIALAAFLHPEAAWKLLPFLNAPPILHHSLVCSQPKHLELSWHSIHYFEALSPSWVALDTLLRSICLFSHSVGLRIDSHTDFHALYSYSLDCIV